MPNAFYKLDQNVPQARVVLDYQDCFFIGIHEPW